MARRYTTTKYTVNLTCVVVNYEDERLKEKATCRSSSK